MSATSPDFPPATIEAFLRSCAGEWMALRSRFAPTDAAEAGDGDEWHTSERGELVVAFLEPGDAGSIGGLSSGPTAAWGGPASAPKFAASAARAPEPCRPPPCAWMW
jgi:hypothetical protein